MYTHIVGNEIMTVFHRHLLLPVKEAAHHWAELRAFVFQSVHVRREYRAFPLFHVEPDVSGNDTRVTGLVDDVEVLVLQRVFQRGEIIKEASYRTAHPRLRAVYVLYLHAFVTVFFVRMKIR